MNVIDVMNTVKVIVGSQFNNLSMLIVEMEIKRKNAEKKLVHHQVLIVEMEIKRKNAEKKVVDHQVLIVEMKIEKKTVDNEKKNHDLLIDAIITTNHQNIK
jgi:hypothetical protein